MDGVEFADEARAGLPLKLSEQTLLHHALACEYAQVCRTPIDGMYVTPSALDNFQWFGIIFVRKGIFCGGIFRFVVNIPKDFPLTSTLPEVVFDNSIFHPLIDLKTRKLDLSRSFPDGWKSDKHDILRVLIVVQRIFFSYDFDFETCVNPEAAILYKEHREKFREMSKETVEMSRAQVYDDTSNDEESNAIRLTPWDASVHDAIREQMMLIGDPRNSQSQRRSAKTSNRVALPTAGEFRRECDVRDLGASTVTEIIGRHFPRSYSWVDPDQMTILTQAVREGTEAMSETQSTVNSARLDRERHGIEPLDLSGVQEATPKSSPKSAKENGDVEHRKLERLNAQNGKDLKDVDSEQSEVVI